MAGNSYGRIFRLTTFGESHGIAVGGIIDGCPANIEIDEDFIQQKIAQRQVGAPRNDKNTIIWLSGLLNGKTTGTALAFMIYNDDHHSKDYQQEQFILKPSHGHYVYLKKFGVFDYRGGGRASGRETIVRVIAGCIAMQYLKTFNIDIQSYTLQIGNAKIENFPHNNFTIANTNRFHCPDKMIAEQMEDILVDCRNNGDTIGCKVGCIVKNLPIGLGNPIFDKLSADLAKAIMTINAAKGFEYGIGYKFAESYGSQVNDLYNSDFSTKTNYSGGITAGISNGEILYFTCVFKPIPTIMKDQESIDIYGQKATLKGKGRHDICLAPRVLPIVEAMAALCLINHLLEFNAYKQ